MCSLPDSAGQSTLVTSAGSFGRLVTDVDFTLSTATGRFVSASAHQRDRQERRAEPRRHLADRPGTTPAFVRNPAWVDPAAKVIADKYRTAVAPLANRVVGSITADITTTTAPSGESALGDVIADGMMAYSTSATPDLAIMNPGGIRASLIYSNSAGGEAPGQVTYGEAFTVQPFNNLVVTRTYTGAQLKEVLEQQWSGYAGQTSTKILQVSDEITYTYDPTRALGDRVSDIQVHGTPIDPAGVVPRDDERLPRGRR